MEWVAPVKCDIGAFLQCGSYYPLVTYADELWDGFYLQACKDLDEEFPNARLLPEGSWSLGLSPRMVKLTEYRMKEEESYDL